MSLGSYPVGSSSPYTTGAEKPIAIVREGAKILNYVNCRDNKQDSFVK